MLAKKKLIPLSTEFGRIRQTGKMYDSPSFGLLIDFLKEKESNGEAKVAFVVSKKIDKRSVVRHDVKRKLADSVTGFLPRLAKNVELVFLAKQGAIKTERKDLVIEMEQVFKRAKLL